MTPDPSARPATRVVHAGRPDDAGGLASTPAVPPVHQVATYRLPSLDVPPGSPVYSRVSNPTRDALERCVADLDGGTRALATSSGIAAVDLVLRTLCRPGHHLLLPDDVYGGMHQLLTAALEPWGVTWTAVPMQDVAGVSAALEARPTAVVWAESPSNPSMHVVDLAAVAEAAHAHGARFVVDGTFATPWLQQPLLLGADVVVHSATKYLSGHSDVVSGVVVTADDELAERMHAVRTATGAIAGPQDSWLVLRGIRTLAVRMEKHCDNAEAIASWLTGDARVAEVLYPGLPEHPGHDVAARQMRRAGGMLSLRPEGGEAAARRLCERLRLFALAASLGGVESLVGHPASMSHATTAGSPFAPPRDLVRLSVGIEDVADLVADLDQALG